MLKSDIILEGMHKLHPIAIDLSLDRLIELLAKLGNPQANLPAIIHIAGTNGKGSTLAYMKYILQNHGKKVHSYTSPHMVKFTERISLAQQTLDATNIAHSQDIEEQAFVDILEEVLAINDGEPITFFEMTTAVAFVAFSRVKADYLLLEVGLGGRFDATNVIDEVALSIITPVSIDHTEYLGNKIAKIAFEKAGIIKDNCPLIVGPQTDDAFDVIEKIALEKHAKMISYGVEFQAYEEHNRLIYQDQTGLLDLPMPALIGAHQVQNASIAIAACEYLLGDTFKEAFTAIALKQVKWPARFERLNSNLLNTLIPTGAHLWLDGGHNAAGGIALAQQLLKLNQAHSMPLYLIVGMLKSKEADAFLKPFIALNPKLFCLDIEGREDSFDLIDLTNIATNIGLEAAPAHNIMDALKQIKLDCKTPPRILICGSLYQAGNILRLIEDANA
ncbi:MAG: bifunctional folylpolyglutamate synthase/dihydrofolate synthase [Rhizobiales bacterium]|nr:bifunctional folylpolyglutamate synthase/dihydrofolate synthase [Hyphomicrobiales bacterium]